MNKGWKERKNRQYKERNKGRIIDERKKMERRKESSDKGSEHNKTGVTRPNNLKFNPFCVEVTKEINIIIGLNSRSPEYN